MVKASSSGMSLISSYSLFSFSGWEREGGRVGVGWALIRGWALINFFSAFWMGAYSRPELIRCWALI